MDFYATENANGSRDHAGMYFAAGHGEVDVTHNLLGRTFNGGTNDFDAFSVGGYWTHFGGDPDWYLDGVVQATWYDVTAQSRRGLAARLSRPGRFGLRASPPRWRAAIRSTSATAGRSSHRRS